ncbi:MAG: hypothetical protein HYV96_12620 [Opitutae bacterium]|nr:hypothetical protein [Opitutae bacterium]
MSAATEVPFDEEPLQRRVAPPPRELKSSAASATGAPAQLITKWGLLGAAGAIGAGAALWASAPLWAIPGGLAVLGATAGRYFTTPSTAAPKGAPKLSEEQLARLAELRAKTKIGTLSVNNAAAFTDEVAGRRREKNAYRQWQLGGVSDGKPLGKDGKSLGAGRYIYVVTSGNEFRYLPMQQTGKEHYDQYRTHSQLAGKQQVFAAGAFVVGDAGFLTHIDNESGHYQPPHLGHADYAAALLKEMGLHADIKTSAHDASRDPKGKALLKAHVTANARALKTWAPGTKKKGWEFGFPEPDKDLKRDMPF